MIQPVLTALLELIPEAVVVTNLTGDILMWNGGAEKLYGYE